MLFDFKKGKNAKLTCRKICDYDVYSFFRSSLVSMFSKFFEWKNSIQRIFLSFKLFCTLITKRLSINTYLFFVSTDRGFYERSILKLHQSWQTFNINMANKS